MNTLVMPWYVVRVRAHAERKVAESLEGRGIEVFLPLEIRSSKSRARRVELPLFPGYIFAQFNPDKALTVLTSPGVVHILSRGSQPEPVDAGEIFALMSVTRIARSVRSLASLAAGQEVTIGNGPLAGVRATVVREKGLDRLIVSISLLRRSVIAEVERGWVEDAKPIVEICHWAPIQQHGVA